MTVPQFGVRERDRVYRARPAAYVVILNDALHVACVREQSGLFLPGGGLEAGENPVQAAHREVAEECGFALEIIGSLGSAVQFLCTGRGEAFELRASFFLGRFGPRIGDGLLEIQYLPALPEPPALFHECHRRAVGQAVRPAGR